MKQMRLHDKLTISILMFLLFICISLPVLSQEEDNQNNLNAKDYSDISVSPLRKAHLNLESAVDSFNEDDIDATKQHLEMASKWLNKASQNSRSDKAKEESRQLAIEIDSFKEKINKESEQHENSLARFWHQTTSIIKRETDQLIHSYVKLSIAEKTLNHLLDAKMHLYRAKYDLFVSHDEDDAGEELSKVLNYMNEAIEVAEPGKHSEIINLSKDIQRLKDNVTKKKDSWESDSEIIALDKALENLNEAKQNASPTIKLRIESLKADLNTLRDDIEKNNIKNDYESAMAKLNNIIVNL